MAVLTNNTVRIIPINRGVATELIRQSLFGLIGRFHGLWGATGDLTGANVTVTFDIPNLAAMFGQFAICELLLASCWMSVNAAGNICKVQVLTGEQTSSTVASLAWKCGKIFAAGSNVATYEPYIQFPKIYFRSAEQFAGITAQVQFVWDANVNGEGYYCSVYGNILDERSL